MKELGVRKNKKKRRMEKRNYVQRKEKQKTRRKELQHLTNE